MKKNAPNKNIIESNTEQANYAVGAFPVRRNTVTADVLACLLESRVMTGIESVFSQSTTRLGAVIFYLEHHHGWIILRREKIVGTNDGRVQTVSEYFLANRAIEVAFQNGAQQWIESVRNERAKRRKLANKCKWQAEKLNASHAQYID
jgi:hypothetical protein